VVHLLRHDSVHRRAPLAVRGERRGDRDYVVLDGRAVPLFHATQPSEIPFGELGVRLAVESSGRFTARAEAARHLKGSVARVVVSAPSPDADITLIAPLNGDRLDLAVHEVVSNASCTAHATGPLLDVLERAFGIAHAGMSTVHVVTNDQRLADAPHKDLRRARAAFQNIIPTTSSAIGALHRALPWLPESFQGLALRVPTLSVNLVDLVAVLDRDVDAEAVREAYREAASGRLAGILGLAHEHAVSGDFTGREESVLVDLPLTQVLGTRFVKVFGWHDNETGYAARLVDLVTDLAAR
jgi:glyceraldehyde 3-phosphate dehydrogenase